MSLHKRSQSSTRSSHGNLSQGSVTSADNHSADEVEGTAQPCKTKIAERRSNSSIDMQGRRCCIFVNKDLGWWLKVCRFTMISFCGTKWNENNNDIIPLLPLFGQTDNPGPNSHNWLSQSCYFRLFYTLWGTSTYSTCICYSLKLQDIYFLSS